MLMSEWSENKLIQYITDKFANKPGISELNPSTEGLKTLTTGIGDDCAVFPKDNLLSWLVTTDGLVQNIHFLKEHIQPFDLGYKSLIVNVSDIAAMGGTPRFAFLTMALPPNLPVAWVKQFFDGIDSACKKHQVILMGGDTTGSKQNIFINITLIGEIETQCIKYRSGAKPGDHIFATGPLGESALGLKYILDKPNQHTLQEDFRRLFINAHYKPTAYVQEGAWLSKQTGVTSIIDVSDGLLSDIKQICRASQALNPHGLNPSVGGATIDINKLPLTPNFITACKQSQYDPINLAINGGEDYVLLGTIDANETERIVKEYNNWIKSDQSVVGRTPTELYIIGKIEHLPGIRFKNKDTKHSIKEEIFNHFSV